MPDRPEVEAYLLEVEAFLQRKLPHHSEIASLLELVEVGREQQTWNDILFFSKFITKAYGILARVGSATDETAKLSVEFTEKLEKTSSLLHSLIKDSPEDFKKDFTNKFLSLSQDGVKRLLSLLADLSCLKNYDLDMKHPS